MEAEAHADVESVHDSVTVYVTGVVYHVEAVEHSDM